MNSYYTGVYLNPITVIYQVVVHVDTDRRKCHMLKSLKFCS